jgi:hypothetical protein
MRKWSMDENLWDGYAVTREDTPTKINITAGERWECPEHGPLRNPEICRARYKIDEISMACERKRGEK